MEMKSRGTRRTMRWRTSQNLCGRDRCGSVPPYGDTSNVAFKAPGGKVVLIVVNEGRHRKTSIFIPRQVLQDNAEPGSRRNVCMVAGGASEMMHSRRKRVNRKMAVMSCGMAVVLACLGAVLSPLVLAAQKETVLAVTKLRCEYKVDPLGIDVRKPRLSWELVSAEKGVMQTSYEVRVAASEAELAKGKVIWESGKQASDASIQVEYGGPAVESARDLLLGRCAWRIIMGICRRGAKRHGGRWGSLKPRIGRPNGLGRILWKTRRNRIRRQSCEVSFR